MESSIPMTVAIIAGFVFCIVVHECAHAVVALWLGDTTARDMGRITLNPIPHIDLFASVLMPVALYLSGLPMFGGAKPVPVDMMRFKHPFRDMMWVALAGPASNILLAIVFALLVNIFPLLVDWNLSFAKNYLTFLQNMVITNVLLACFNMIPIPPLDGSRLLAALLKREHAIWVYSYQAQMVGMVLIMVLVFTGGTAVILPVARLIWGFIVRFTVFV